MADLLLRLIAEDAASGAFDSVGGAAKKTAAILYDFAKDSVKAFAESERVQKQLARAAGENADAFSAMAEAMSDQLAVEDEEIKQLQTLALSYGVLPQNVEGATRAVLDYAAATGRDAKGAMQQLINGVEAGNGSLGRMGVSFQETGDKAKDMALAIEAMGTKFGGAAAADADTLEGRTRKASIAMGELEEAFGGLLATVEAKTGVLEKVTNVLRNMADSRAWSGGTRGVTWEDPAAPSVGSVGGASAASLRTHYGKDVDVTFGDVTLKQNEKKKGGSKPGKDDWGWGPFGDPEKSFDGWLAEKQEYDQKKLDALNETSLKEAAESTKRYQIELAEEEKHDAAMFEAKQKASKMQLDWMLKQTDQEAKELQKRTKIWMNAGMQIGQAVINGIFEAIQLATSGEGDQSKQQIKIVQGIFNTIFSAFGMGWMSQMGFGAMNASEQGGALAGFGSFAAGTAGASAQMGFSSNHSGGYIQRFHQGGYSMRGDEQLALLQTGERVLSRREVGAMGGPAGVESAVRGGGRSVTIQAFDSSSLLSFFGDRGGRGMLNAARANIGPLRLMFGKA